MKKKYGPYPKEVTRVEPIKIQVLMTETGYPADLGIVRDCYGGAQPAPEPGWFWIFATPASASDMRRRGLHRIGTLTTSFAPPQTAIVIDKTVERESIPVPGTREFTDLMLAETRVREAAFSGS